MLFLYILRNQHQQAPDKHQHQDTKLPQLALSVRPALLERRFFVLLHSNLFVARYLSLTSGVSGSRSRSPPLLQSHLASLLTRIETSAGSLRLLGLLCCRPPTPRSTILRPRPPAVVMILALQDGWKASVDSRRTQKAKIRTITFADAILNL